jgi:hypothetical protein
MHGTLGRTRGNSAVLLRRYAAKANAEARAAEEHHRKSVVHAIRCGEALIKAKAVLNQHGEWEKWLRKNFEHSVRTARLYMQLAGLDLAKRQRVADLPLREALGAVVKSKRLLQSVECYTPTKYIEAVRRVLGGIDLDPASCAEANRVVRATRYFSKEQDGLSQPWRGLTWLNCPYCGQAGPWIAKLDKEYRAGSVTAAIVLVSGRDFDAKWFQPLFDYPLCFTNHRVAFYKNGSNPQTGSIFAYLGPDPDAFEREFAQFGNVMARYRRRAA